MRHDLNDMLYFAKVVEHGGFGAAARALGVQTSLISRRVAELESRLGVRLLHRSTRRMVVTEVGQRYYQHCCAVVAEAQAAHDAMDHIRSEPCGLVRLSCPSALLQQSVGPVLVRFLAAHPRVKLRVEATNRRVDVIEEGIDLALRVRNEPLEDSGLAVRVLGVSETVLVASPALLERCGRPQQLADLDALPTMGPAWDRGRNAWNFIGPDGKTAVHGYEPRLAVDDFTTLRATALAGLAVGVLPAYTAQDDISSGRLERVLSAYSFPRSLVHAAFASRRGLMPGVRALLDALAEEIGRQPGM
ncbi:LysR substrate-binding domain-containing protein [Xylophilus sp.]|uniref:LysR substrate-binding domain-containing protein n=1 Tax=Xylophilus sp. TaxID=2653893 RepID=UPI0013BBAAB6|nr:LysR substrate-binding domain-containing protein [Xylophilus sp.]KAF1047423.1 MAG: HTH-type transcriptional regulator DmlR [Xylophilus sp.]